MRVIPACIMAVALAIATTVLFASPVHAMGCSGNRKWLGSCENSGHSVDVGGTQTTRGSDGSRSTDDRRAPRASAPDPEPSPTCTALCDRGNYMVVLIRDAVPAVTVSDLASFVPARPSLTGEPAGVGAVGMPANIVASASEQSIARTLFGTYDVVVRFVPAEFVFSYGDGSTRTSATGGRSWASLGQAEFTPTPTSHVYRARGTYPVAVTVRYTASVGFAGNVWLPVDGYVEASTGGYDVRVVEVRTALVDKTCLENPRGEGC